MMKQKILIIEDDPVIQTELITLLDGNGYGATAVTDFTAVVQTVKAFQPHLILLDIKLPHYPEEFKKNGASARGSRTHVPKSHRRMKNLGRDGY